METCTVETGLLKKKPCGQTAVTHCATCEQPLCKQHVVAQSARKDRQVHVQGVRRGAARVREEAADDAEAECGAAARRPQPAPPHAEAPKPARRLPRQSGAEAAGRARVHARARSTTSRPLRSLYKPEPEKK